MTDAIVSDTDDHYEYAQLRMDRGTSRATAATMLSVHAEFSGWELARVLGYTDGTRRVWLRRKLTRTSRPAAG